MEQDVVSLPADGRAAGLARSVVRSRLQEWDLDDLLDTAMLLTSEVVTNVIVHTASAPELELTQDGSALLVRVVEPLFPLVRFPAFLCGIGRPIYIINCLLTRESRGVEGSLIGSPAS